MKLWRASISSDKHNRAQVSTIVSSSLLSVAEKASENRPETVSVNAWFLQKYGSE